MHETMRGLNMSCDRDNKRIRELIEEGYTLLKMNDFSRAMECYQEILKLDETNLVALNSMGFIHYFNGDYKKGEEICRRTLSLYPQNAYAHKGLGLHLAKLGRVDEAIDVIKKAIELKKDFIDAYHDLAYVLYENGQYEEAKRCLKEGLSKATTPEMSQLLKRFLKKLENLPKEL